MTLVSTKLKTDIFSIGNSPCQGHKVIDLGVI